MKLSTCCQAAIILTDICAKCREHCEIECEECGEELEPLESHDCSDTMHRHGVDESGFAEKVGLE